MANDKVDSVVQQIKDLVSTKATIVNDFIEFEDIENKGILWLRDDYNKQLVFRSNPDRIFLSETLELAEGKSLNINGIEVINQNGLGKNVVKSNLREVGRLKNLDVDGSFSVNQYMFYNAGLDSLSIGTETPHATFTVADGQTEIVIGSQDFVNGLIGTYNSSDLSIVTDNKTRITVGANGNIDLGNKQSGPIKVKVHGAVGIGVNNIDSRMSLDAVGPIKFNGVAHFKDNTFPIDGTYNRGDVVWNSEPATGSYMGWVCVQGGTPGQWKPFGEIK